jgi:hydrogenase-4 membrane subunit HyfE
VRTVFAMASVFVSLSCSFYPVSFILLAFLLLTLPALLIAQLLASGLRHDWKLFTVLFSCNSWNPIF